MKVTALIPAYNEEERIVKTIHAAEAIPAVSEVVVVDDGSSDGTVEAIKTTNAHLICAAQNGGKGAALELGAEACKDADIVLLLDGDLAESAKQGELILEPVLAGNADMSIARFPKPTGKAGFGLVKNLAREGIVELGGPKALEFECEAPLSGQRALTRECLEAVRPFASGYGVEIALTVKALRADMRLCEVQTTMTHAATGRDLAGFIHRGKQYLDVKRAIRKLRKELRA